MNQGCELRLTEGSSYWTDGRDHQIVPVGYDIKLGNIIIIYLKVEIHLYFMTCLNIYI